MNASKDILSVDYEQLRKEVFLRSEDPILILQEDTFIDCNPAAIKILHAQSKQNVLNTHPTDISPINQADGRLSSEKSLEMILLAQENHFHRFEWMHKTLDGKDFPCEVTLTTIPSEDKTLLHVTWRDLSLAKEVQKKEHFLEAAIHQSSGGILTASMEGIILECNPAWAQMHGFSNEEMLGNNVYIFHSKQQVKEQVAPFFEHVLAEGSYSGEIERTRKNGESFPSWTTVTLVHDQRGLPIGYIGSTIDITEQKKAREDLLAAENMLRKNNKDLEKTISRRTAQLTQAVQKAEDANLSKSQFLANMSHELRTPMHAILSFSRLGLKRLANAAPEKIEQYFQNISDSGERLLLLLNDLLDLSKLESSTNGITLTHADLYEITHKCAIEHLAILNEKKLILEIIPPECDTTIYLDPMRITQVITNLLGNAIKFTEETKRICISIEHKSIPSGRYDLNTDDQKVLLFSIIDEGIGIPEDELKTVFNKFIQSSKTRSKSGGTGLGLAICKEIITAHNGLIWADITEQGGARFQFQLPINIEQ